MHMHVFWANAVKYWPRDVELIEEVSLQQFSEWLLLRVERLPDHLLQRIRDLESLKGGLTPILSEMRGGDSLWLCQSRLREPLQGHEGVALVRDDQPVVYIRVLNY
ncbi:hypothetical protein GCM10007874_31830 [Labrys miyagiensis]|uniref:Uncharacterized protein n=1 Tax=Labrys miyagiensis TaxID=346912 RepID=A0ABQ6CPL1_9HYPH|nr:hypothetical protein GCM10007874_31830 [Labrys miyagiensis]